MNISVTGAAGHLGGFLVRDLLAQGHTVRALVHHDGAALEGLAIDRVDGDVLDPAAVARLVDGAEIVYHLAARIQLLIGEAEAVRAVNVEGTRNVVKACRAAGVRRLVHFSSIHAIEHEPRHGVVDETRDLVTRDAPTYGLTKAAGERVVMDAVRDGLDAVVVRPTGCMGPLDFRPSAIGQALLDMARGRVPALAEGGFNWVDCRDVVRSAIAAASLAKTGERYILGGTWQHIRETAALVHEVTGARTPRIVLPMWVAQAAVPFFEGYTRLTNKPVQLSYASLHALRFHQKVDDGKARRELGHTSRPIRETMTDLFNWYRETGRYPARAS
mgnify:CR=1 FL=1